MNTRKTPSGAEGRGLPSRRSRGATMVDVAMAAGVSQTTVSLVLNRVSEARLSADTRKRVYAAAEELGYAFSRRGSARLETSAPVICFAADEYSSDPWCSIAMDGVRERAVEYGFSILAIVARGYDGMEKAIREQIRSQRPAALIVAAIQTRRIKPFPVFSEVPTVLVNCYAADRSLPSIIPGELLGGYTATRHLIDAGHRRIGHIHGQPWIDTTRDRLKGYRRALAEMDIPYDPDLVRPGNWEPPAGYDQTHVLMDLDRPPTAIFCANDLMALGCYDALKERRLRIPEDVSVIGYDDREIAKFMRPPLTTVLMAHFEIGLQAAEMIIDQAYGTPDRRPQIKVECPLVERSSVGPPRSGEH
ncbi:MAG: LacI family DNA-binding transcriptional regulator [Alphaproteobacteria bacterium]